MIKQWTAALAIVLLAGLGACAPQPLQEPGAIRFAIDSTPFPPFSAPDASGKWTGFEVDLMDAVCAEMKAKCVLVPTPWDGLIAQLEAKKIDVIWSSMTVTEAREEVIDFSDVYYNTHVVLVAPGTSEIDPERPATMKGKRIAVYPAQEPFARRTFGTAELVPVDPAANQSLSATITASKSDAILLDQFIASLSLKQEDDRNLMVKWTAPWNASGPGVAAGLRKNDSELKARINAALRSIRDSGRYKALNARYFDYDISGM